MQRHVVWPLASTEIVIFKFTKTDESINDPENHSGIQQKRQMEQSPILKGVEWKCYFRRNSWPGFLALSACQPVALRAGQSPFDMYCPLWRAGPGWNLWNPPVWSGLECSGRSWQCNLQMFWASGKSFLNCGTVGSLDWIILGLSSTLLCQVFSRILNLYPLDVSCFVLVAQPKCLQTLLTVPGSAIKQSWWGTTAAVGHWQVKAWPEHSWSASIWSIDVSHTASVLWMFSS